ncbi:MAG: MATE family efflux transporter [Clostridia bacterium]|nr:MATE family efflux transporter [Clostridia bacterium]
MRDRRVFDKTFYRKLTRLTLPIAFQSLMLAAVAAGDAVMLGRLDQNSMAAVSLATQVQFVQNMALYAVTGAIAILGAQYWGRGDRKTIDDIFSMSLRLAGIVSFFFFAVCVFFPAGLMRLFAHDGELVRIGASYLKIAGWSYLLAGISQCYLAVMKISERAAASAWISAGAVVLNIALNAVFIFGLFSAPAMGADGAALATLISRIAELVAAVGVSFRKGFIRLKLRALFRRSKALARDYAKCALPILGGATFWGVGFTTYTAIMGHMGADAAAAASVAAVVRDLMCCATDGVAAAGGIMVGNELGAGKLEKGKRYGERLSKLSVLIGVFSTAVVLAVTPAVVRYMKLTDEARRYLVGIMIVMAVYMIGRAVNTVVINGVFAAGGDTMFDMYSLAVCMWGVAIPLAALGAFVFHWPVVVVYIFTCADEVGKLPWVFAHYKRYKWVRDLTKTY